MGSLFSIDANSREQAASEISPPPPPKESLQQQSVEKLKSQLAELGIDFSSAIEKRDLVELLFDGLGGGESTCAICFADDVKTFIMPCCGRENSDLKYCRRCLEIIARDFGSDQSVGVCPTCRKHFKISSGPNNHVCIEPHTMRGRCRMCMQDNKVIVNKGFCDKCLLGQEYSFVYECNRCHRRQRIPHPMFMYQTTPDSYSGATWACHQQCHDYTNWKICPEEVARVPAAHCPETWTRQRDAWLAQVRQESQTQGRTNVNARS